MACKLYAEVAELADALRSGRSECTLMRVQIPPSAHGPRISGVFFLPKGFSGTVIAPAINDLLVDPGNSGYTHFMEKNEKKQFDFRQILLLVGMVVAFYIVFDLSGKISAANEKVRERDQMSTRVVGYQQTQNNL